MSDIPKLKVYRLSQNFDTSNDNDIQYKSHDELMPIVKKNISLRNDVIEELVGVKPRGDARLVVESNGWNEKTLWIDKSKQSLMETLPFPCDGWVLGKGNFEVLVMWAPTAPGVGDSVGWKVVDRMLWDYSVSDVKMYRRQFTITGSTTFKDVWFEGIHYEGDEDTVTISPGSGEESRTFYLDSDSPIFYYCQGSQFVDDEKLSAYPQETHQLSFITFRLGDMLTGSTEFFNKQNGYSDFSQIIDFNATAAQEGNSSFLNRIKIHYKKYAEYGEDPSVQINDAGNGDDDSYMFGSSLAGLDITDSATSRFRVPFGNIYNGNKSGRHVVPVSSGMSFYEGNYTYRKRIFPLRSKIADVSDDYDAQIDENWSCEFVASENWYADGLMKPVIMERLLVDAGQRGERYIFKPLIEGTQVTKVYKQNSRGDGTYYPSYKITFSSNYYRLSNGLATYPSRIYLFYNETEDSLGDIFDFNYDYSDTTKFSINGYGYENNGVVFVGDDSKAYENASVLFDVQSTSGDTDPSLPSSPYRSGAFKKLEFLAVADGYGYESSRGDILLTISGTDLSFQLPSGAYEGLGVSVYADGEKIAWENADGTFDASDEMYSLSKSGSVFTLSIDTENDIPKDLMISCYEKLYVYPYPNEAVRSRNVIGYRVPCYEKSKKANLFVSSFPNWLKGHLNNDLDVFYGYKLYSGMESQGSTTVNSLLPNYLRVGGWHALYPEGAVQFTDEMEEYDFFDVFNFGTQTGAVSVDYSSFFINGVTPSGQQSSDKKTLYPNYQDIDSNLKLYYNKVMYNVAHYDAIYSVARGRMSNISVQGNKSTYALLDDEGFEESYGKRWATRTDNSLRRMFSAGQTELPEILSVGMDEKEEVQNVSISADEDTLMYGHDKNILRINTSDNRVTMLSYVSGGDPDHRLVLCLNKDKSEHKVIANPENGDIRIHVKVDMDEYGEYVLMVGPDSGNTVTQITLFDESVNPVEWHSLYGMKDRYADGTSMSDVQTSSSDGGEIIQYKYETPVNWLYDVYFEAFSYRYTVVVGSHYKGSHKQPVSSVEFLVYRKMKEE